MVFLCKISFSSRMRNYLREGIRDSLKLYVAGGSGGNGLPKFGGAGGNGGNVKIIARENATLDQVYKRNKSKRYIAKNGTNASHNFILGPPGENILIEVPVGITVYTELGKKLGDLDEDGAEMLIARGGSGGHSKNGYLGTKGQMYDVRLDLKLIADIGLVGFPNAGKSTLLNALSHAKARVASYPFTTVRPNVGIIEFSDLRQISIADLPGLIEGAHKNKGMGHSFLKHVERTKLLLFVVDINGFRLSPQYAHRNCLETVLLLNKEIELYNADLLNKPSLLVVNKMDSDGATETFNSIRESLKNLPNTAANHPEEMQCNKFVEFSDIIPISAKECKEDVEMVKQKLRTLLDVLEDLQQELDAENTDLYNSMKQTSSEKHVKYV